ncbi:MAG: hypothetical protein IBJ11_03365 [Phycisphaerales bacterium]|nr:hypothetical protein [Phycisphaerales bacterium]
MPEELIHPATLPATNGTPAIPDDHLAALFAACAVVLGRRARIRAVMPLREEASGEMQGRWIARGRRMNMESHEPFDRNPRRDAER